MKSYTTINDIARHVGLSKSTVARALANSSEISSKAKDKILLAAEELGYQKHPMLSTWMSHVRHKRGDMANQLEIAWIDEMGEDPKVWAPVHRFFEGSERHASKLGYHIVRHSFGEKQMTPKRICQIIRARNVAGVIYFLPGGEVWQNLLMPEFPAVCLGGSVADIGMPMISTSHAENVEIAFNHLKGLGYRKIGLSLATQVLHLRSQADYGVYLKCCHLHNQKPFVNWYENVDKDVLKWISESKIDAVIVCDSRFEGLLRRSSLPYPEKVALAHLNINEDVEDWAGIVEPHEKIGTLALDTLNSQIITGQKLKDQFSVRMRIPGKWQDGHSAPGKPLKGSAKKGPKKSKN